MRKSIPYGLLIMVVGGAGCSTDYSNYQCKSNDECLVGSKGQTSCSIETSKCEPVSPITVTDNGKWKPPKVGQPNFSVELVASGGMPPYSWDFSKINDGGKLDWLTYKVEEGSNRVKLWLVNKVVDNVTQTPQDTIDSGAGTRIKVTVRDNTKIGENMDRIDNKGVEWETTVTVEECTTEQCESDDGCCPAICTVGNDNDCPPKCGDEIVTSPPETCDPPDACPATCDDGNKCTSDSMTGSAESCDVVCTSTVITQCADGDDCCPENCNNANDSDCLSTCDNDIIEAGETCDPSDTCPTSCDDDKPCTIDTMTGTTARCNVACGHLAITQCTSGDGCCPSGCYSNTDTDCDCECGNNVVEVACNETCDDNCPTACPNDGNACTNEVITGNASTCNVVCTHPAIVPCCGNGVVENGEICDGNCPTTCPSDDNACTNEVLTGNASTCNVVCAHPAIVPCCGNRTVESGETCDTAIAGNCPSSCDDGNTCTIDTLNNAGTCLAACTHTTNTSCDGKNCGDNGCGVSCGTCTLPATCGGGGAQNACGYNFNTPLISVPGGTFTFKRSGSGATSTVPAFRMSKYEIKQSQFAEVTGLANPSYFTDVTNGPVEQVSWYHALVFCNSLSMLQGLTPVYTINGSTNPTSWGAVPTATDTTWDAVTVNWSANGYRLPTQMEWLWAAMGATDSMSKAFAGSTGSNSIVNYSWLKANASNTTHQVGSTMYGNELNLYDMTGNVWEWCWDWYIYPDPTGTIYDYTGPSTGLFRIMLGASWKNEAYDATLVTYNRAYPYTSSNGIGFRVIRRP